MDYYVLLVDGNCYKINAEDKITAWKILSEQLAYDSFDEFLDDLNICEWKENGSRFLQNCTSPNDIEEFEDSEYQLKQYLTITKTKKTNQSIG